MLCTKQPMGFFLVRLAPLSNSIKYFVWIKKDMKDDFFRIRWGVRLRDVPLAAFSYTFNRKKNWCDGGRWSIKWVLVCPMFCCAPWYLILVFPTHLFSMENKLPLSSLVSMLLPFYYGIWRYPLYHLFTIAWDSLISI